MEENNKGLMKKTKAQLIEIIIRKDAVERECRDEINNLKTRIKNYDSDIEGMNKRIKDNNNIIKQQADLIIEKETIIEDMKSQFDISSTEIAEAKETVFMYKDYIKALSVSCAALIIALICELFVF